MLQRDDLAIRIKDLESMVGNLTESVAVLQRLNLSANASNGDASTDARNRTMSYASAQPRSIQGGGTVLLDPVIVSIQGQSGAK